MLKIKHLLLFSLTGLLILSCETKKANPISAQEQTNSDTLELNVDELNKDQAQLSELRS